MLDPKGLAAAFEAGDDHCRHTALPPRLAYAAAIRAYLEATGEAKPVCFIQSEVLAMLSTDKTATGTVCSGLLKAPFGNPVPLYAAPVPATSAQVAPDGKTKENGNHVSDSNLGKPLVDSRALDGRRVAVGADTLGDHGGDRLVHRPLAQSKPPSLVAAPVPATDTARPLNSGEVEALREALDFVNETSGAALGLAMSGDNHPNPDGVLMDISRKGMDLAPRLFAALSSAPSTPEGWRDMASAPTDGSRVICWNSEWETPESGCLYGFVWAANSLAANKGGWKYQPTNWMPLPTPPAGGGDG